MNSAKEYLMQLEELDKKIAQRKEESEELYSLITGGSLTCIFSEKVQKSNNLYSQDAQLAKYIDMRLEIKKLIDEMVDRKHIIIDQIHSLEAGNMTSVYIEILYLRYVNFTPLSDVACKLSYNFKWICKLHNRALRCFENQVLNARSD